MATNLPSGLAAALAERGAAVTTIEVEGARRYVVAGELFARFTTDPSDEPAFLFEVATRGVVGDRLPLRAPGVLASGPGWMLERTVERRPPAGDSDIRAVIAAALAIPDLDLPTAPPGTGGESGAARWTRRVRMVTSGLRPTDLLLARRQPELPRVPAHGDFHAGNILCEADGPWIIDWELAAPRPLGYDLLSLWPTLADPFDRRLVLEAALEQAGPEYRTEIMRLRFALLVRALAAVVGAPRGFGGVGPPASELRRLLADARREAAE